ncbi:S-type pyocin family protein [Brevundimonas sp. GW460-12-10-14-LB2]|uniref:S-type pyocin family protein n=1 Tax=Brevundimonas sp. GW460-12-10-14-LB2 TaxID=1827469 RepID=UPI000B12A576|nr:S-type pyocin family protein [Brevundimonas sp. GW460-12-10-14-LB2]
MRSAGAECLRQQFGGRDAGSDGERRTRRPDVHADGKRRGCDASGKPVLTANRRETVDAKIARLYDRNGADFGARSAEDYLTKVTAFTTKPPRDAETVKRPNGDTLIYQASTNTFAVVARNGSPRTMFKPTTGADYWAEQKAAAPTFGQRRQSTGAAG